MKSIRRTIRKALHPRRVQPVYMDGRAVSEEVCDNVNAYLAIYCVILVLSFVIISADGFSIGTNFSAVASCFNNIGPGFELVGATENYSIYSDLSKIVLSLDMLLGRLEIFPLPASLQPRYLEPQKITFAINLHGEIASNAKMRYNQISL